jgi:hypothetical protein
MPRHGHDDPVSGTSLSAQARYVAGTRKILECRLSAGGSGTNTSSLTAASSPA